MTGICILNMQSKIHLEQNKKLFYYLYNKMASRRSKSGIKKKSKCRKALSKKIAINMDEFKHGRFVSRAQAIAVSYSQVKKHYPKCKF